VRGGVVSDAMGEVPIPELVLNVGHEGCGTLLVALRKQIQLVAPGGVLEVVGYDPGAREDVPAWCRMTRNPLVATTGDLARGGPIRYFIRRGE